MTSACYMDEFSEFNGLLKEPDLEVVLIVGDPCSGKSKYSEIAFSEKHKHISIAEQDKSLHRIINLILRTLKEGSSVVFDLDANFRQEKNRKTLVQDIKTRCEEQNILNVKLKCVVVSAKGGKNQCLWANEFALAEHALLMDVKTGLTLSKTTYIEPDMDEYFNFDPPRPSFSEGFNQITNVQNGLYARSTPFLNGALMLVCHSFLEFTKEQCVSKFSVEILSDMISEVLDSINGSLVLLIDESILFPASLMFLAETPLEQRRKLIQYRQSVIKFTQSLPLTRTIQTDVYFVRSEYEILTPTHFFRLPNPGMLAFAQRRLCLNLNRILFVCDNKNELETGKFAGIRSCLASDLFKENKWSAVHKLKNCQHNYNSNRTAFLKEITFFEEKAIDKTQLHDYYAECKEKNIESWFYPDYVEERGGVGHYFGFSHIKANENPQPQQQRENLAGQIFSNQDQTLNSNRMKQEQLDNDNSQANSQTKNENTNHSQNNNASLDEVPDSQPNKKRKQDSFSLSFPLNTTTTTTTNQTNQNVQTYGMNKDTLIDEQIPWSQQQEIPKLEENPGSGVVSTSSQKKKRIHDQI